MGPNCTVDFTASVTAQLSPELRDQLARELRQVFAGSDAVERILVSRWFRSYSVDVNQRVILGVEVRNASGYETHIVKIGSRDEVEPDAQGWNNCTRNRQVGSRILSPVRLVSDLGDGRAAVLYRDAYVLFGLNSESSRPEALETVAEWSVRDDRPELLSVERAVAHIFTDLGRWFYPGATPNREQAVRFYRERLRMEREPAEQIIPLWQSDAMRRQLRRDVVWLICGRDKPDADPVRDPARYLDPVDFVAWMVEEPATDWFPETLVGCTHGDLHGRNILVGVRRGEVEYPAVFDYGEMRTENVLAWDFAKLEMELKVRLLPPILSDPAVQAGLMGTQPSTPAASDQTGIPSQGRERAQRIEQFLKFEEWLHDLTCRVQSQAQAETLEPLSPQYRTGVEKLDRLVALLLRIRKEAALWLGFEHHQRSQKWRDELYFALAHYGLLNVRWDYDPHQVEYALVSAGVAAARMPLTPGMLRQCIEQPRPNPIPYPSYRVPLAIAHNHWKAKEYEEGREIAERTVFEVERNDHGQTTRITVREDYAHAIPLIAEGALLEMECNGSGPSERVLEELREPAREFGDFETLGRIGRLFKDAGDARWDAANVDFTELNTTAAAQMYAKALSVYEEAFLATDDYYTGINAATLALLTGDRDKAKTYALKVASICQQMADIPRNERFWIFATEGEACIIQENWTQAERFYRDALAELSPGQGGMADSAYKQLCRLWKALGPKVEGALAQFETGQFFDALTPVLGRWPAQAP